MLDARVSPIVDILTDDPKTILCATGILSRLWRLLLPELRLDYLKWLNNVDDYLAKCAILYPDTDLSNKKGNLGKALAREEVTWDVFCKGISLLKLKDPRLTLTLTHNKITKVIVTKIPFTCDEDRGLLLSKTWAEIVKGFPERNKEWDSLVTEYGLKQKSLGRNLTNSLKSNLTNTLKSKTIMWSILIKAIEVLNFDKVEIKLCFKATRGRREITLNPK